MFNNHVRGTASMEGMTAVGPQEWRQHTGATRGDGGQTRSDRRLRRLWLLVAGSLHGEGVVVWDGAGWGAVVGEVVCMLSAGVVRSMASWEARDITHTEHKVQKTRDGGVQRVSEKSTGGFQFCGGLPVPTFFLFFHLLLRGFFPFFLKPR